MRIVISASFTLLLWLCGACLAAEQTNLNGPAQKIVEDLKSIATAYTDYEAKTGAPPANVEALVEAGTLETPPKPDCDILENCTDQTRYEIANWGDNDGNGQNDIVIDIVEGGNPNVALCLAVNSLTPGIGSRLWKNEALGSSREPGSWPKTALPFCVCWSSTCDESPSGLDLGDKNIILLLAH